MIVLGETSKYLLRTEQTERGPGFQLRRAAFVTALRGGDTDATSPYPVLSPSRPSTCHSTSCRIKLMRPSYTVASALRPELLHYTSRPDGCIEGHQTAEIEGERDRQGTDYKGRRCPTPFPSILGRGASEDHCILTRPSRHLSKSFIAPALSQSHYERAHLAEKPPPRSPW